MNKVKFLLTYRYSEIIHDLTVEFTQQYILTSQSHLGRPDYRLADQMIQAARSGKQNIVEGVGQSQISKKGEIKLLGVAKASIEELLSDYEDYLRQNKLERFSKDSLKTKDFKDIAYRLSDLRNLSNLGDLVEKPILPKSSEESANFLLTLCHLATYLLDKQIKSLERLFIENGGFAENLYIKRLKNRN